MESGSPSLQSRGDLYEIEVLPGLATVCSQELRDRFAAEAVVEQMSDDSLILSFSGPAGRLTELRTAVAVYRLLYYKVPRPQMICEGGHLRRLAEVITELRRDQSYTGFRISAAGSDSTAFRRIKTAIAEQSGLSFEEEGQLLIRLRRSQLKKVFGWEVLLRLTPLPLSARAWRVCNMPGALNATIAAAMNRMLKIGPQERYLNIACGSGTLIAEVPPGHAASGFIGLDISREALRMAKQNSGKRGIFVQGNAQKLPFGPDSVDVFTADLPWGRLIGDRQELGSLYQSLLAEMDRVGTRHCRAAIITQENKMFDEAIRRAGGAWTVSSTMRVLQSEYKPKIYFLERGAKS